MSSHPDKPLNLELVPGGVREGFARDSQSSASLVELSPDVLEALATDTPLLPIREPLGARLASYFGRHQLLLLVLSFLALWAIVALPTFSFSNDLTPGTIAPRDVVAPQNAFIPDRTETERRRTAASALVTPAYNPDTSALARALDELPSVVGRARGAARRVNFTQPALTPAPTAQAPHANTTPLPKPTKIAPGIQFQQSAGFAADPALIRVMKGASSERWATYEAAAGEGIRGAYVNARVRSDVKSDIDALKPILKNSIEEVASTDRLTPVEVDVATLLASRAARFPNVVVNEKATALARRDAQNAVLPVFQRIEANTPLVREGELITRSQWYQLQELGLVAPSWRVDEILAYGALCLMMVVGAAAYLGRSRRDLLSQPAALWLVAFVPVAFLAAFRLILRVPHADFLMVPLAATCAMLVTVLLDTRIGLPSGFVVAALCALMARADSELFLAATLSAWLGALTVARVPSRLALARSAILMALTNAILAAALGFLREAPLDEILSTIAWSGLAGLASVGVMAAGAIFLERPFGITSHLRLLELLAPDEAVVRRMQVEAPGTYTHSLMVATLAENAAKAVGADSLLCRVGGLYHDIGKLRRPHCFIENQAGDNIHDRLSPSLSALLIKAHVKDGLDLGRAIRLPRPVLEIIASHHGTGLIVWFWNKAKQNSPDGTLDESKFRYNGPRPRTKEAAIILLADSVEASARVLGGNSPEAIASHVQKMVDARLHEGELDDCELSLRELGLIREAFETTLRGALHGRIAYPDAAKLSGELTQNSNDWVREALGEEPRVERRTRNIPRAKESRNGQNKEGAVEPAPEPVASSNTATTPRNSRKARRRFRAANAEQNSENRSQEKSINSESGELKTPINDDRNRNGQASKSENQN